MKILYLDCLSGISGDMTVGALCDLGVDSHLIDNALATLGLGEEFHVHYSREHRQNIEGVKFDVHTHTHTHGHTHTHEHWHPHMYQAPHHHHHHGEEDHGHTHGEHSHTHGEHSHTHGEHAHTHAEHVHGRSFRQIRELLENSPLSEFVKKHSLSIFRRIAEAEGKIHGMPVEDVTFHEVGAIDSIVDIVAACVGIEALKIDKILASPLFEGSGWIQCAHGRFPLPAPATLEILKGIPLRQIEEPQEFITPTGAAILAEFAAETAPLPNIRIEKIGYGIGTRKIPSRPNVLRALLGELAENDDAETDEIIQIETNLDDISSEVLSHAAEKLRDSGALDVFITPVLMKKNRPAFLLTVLCEVKNGPQMEDIIFRETTAFGLRRTSAKRTKLRREIREISTPWGNVRVKFGYKKDTLVQTAPEFDSCREIAEKNSLPIAEIYRAALSSSR